MHIDTHKAFNKLVDAGLQKEAAETIIGVIEESRKYDLDNLATKQDIAAVKQDISTVKQELSDVKSELKQDIANVRLEIANVRTELKDEITSVRSELKKDISDVNIQLSKVIENMNMIKWLCIGILIPIVAASVKVLFSTMFGQ